MFDSNRFLTMIAIISFLGLAFSSLAMAQNKHGKSVAYKTEYVVTEKDQSKLVTVWFDKQYIAFSTEDSTQMAMWINWRSDNPSFFQVFPEVQYCIEFDRLTSHEMQPVLTELKQLINHGQPVDKTSIKHKQFELSSLNSSREIQKIISSWQDFKTYDYADIGDNEADPVLGKLIHEGFVRGF